MGAPPTPLAWQTVHAVRPAWLAGSGRAAPALVGGSAFGWAVGTEVGFTAVGEGVVVAPFDGVCKPDLWQFTHPVFGNS